MTTVTAYSCFDSPITPKRPRREAAEAADVYPYYAGYSYAWASSRLAALENAEGVVLDPWNGSGTSTLAASRLSRRSVGVELSPVPNLIARARLARPEDVRAIRDPEHYTNHHVDARSDPLGLWFEASSARRLRRWSAIALAARQPDASVMLVALFRLVKRLTKQFEGSNPTWTRVARDAGELLAVTDADIDAAVIEEHESVVAVLRGSDTSVQPVLLLSSATALPLQAGSIQHILGSPPYLTRLDYAVAYARELAVLGIDNRQSGLRTKLMGTTRVRKNADWERDIGLLPESLQIVIASIRSHSSKESGGYYLKQAFQYFADLVASMGELTRVAAVGGSLDIVLQDSYYKDIHIPLADLCEDILSNAGWETTARESVPSPRLLTTLNSAAWKNVKGDIHECVLSMVKRW